MGVSGRKTLMVKDMKATCKILPRTKGEGYLDYTMYAVDGAKRLECQPEHPQVKAEEEKRAKEALKKSKAAPVSAKTRGKTTSKEGENTVAASDGDDEVAAEEDGEVALNEDGEGASEEGNAMEKEGESAPEE